MQHSVEDLVNMSKQPLLSDTATQEYSHETPVSVLEPMKMPLPTMIPLDEVTIPDLPIEAFPDALGNMIAAVAQATETPVELAAMIGLATVATCCQTVVAVQGAEGYTEPTSLWTVAALESGNRKTAVHQKMTEPLVSRERALRTQGEAERVAVDSERATIEARVKALRTKTANSEDSEDIARLKNEIKHLEATMPAAPTIPHLWAQDVTPEKLAVLMADNGEKMALLSDEGGLFDIMAGRYSQGIPNLDLYLQAHAGSSVRVDRGSRPPVDLAHPALTIGISPQPSVLRGLTRQPGFRERGLLARFLYALPSSKLGYRTLKTTPVPEAVSTRYSAMIEALLSIDAPKDDNGIVVPMLLHLSNQAQREWQEFALIVEGKMQPAGEYEFLKDWAGKLPGAVLRVAGLFHCVIHAHGTPQNHKISFATLDQALTLLAVLAKHTIAVFDLMGADPALEGARKVMWWVKRVRKKSFTARDCYQALRGSYPTMALLDPALKLLCERGQLVPIESTYTGKGRPPSQMYNIHSDLTKGWI